ncbi:MAG: peptidylprolyl isomerase [Elusimicrobia bacterium]|nr:peptidylprolyl isomerase [Elusimicrobiota bacterium]
MIESGSTVKIHYTLTVDGSILDTSSGKEPLVYVQGAGQIIPGLEEQLKGMHTGDKAKVTISPEKGYGSIDPKAFQKVPKKAFGNQKELRVGSVVRGQQGGQQFQAVVSAVGDQDITLNLNHPLAGKTLDFEVEVVDIQAPKT